MTTAVNGYPEGPRQALSRLLTALEKLAPEPSALVVYGSLAKGTWREGESDVNLAVVLEEARPSTLEALGGPLRAAHRAVRVRPFVVERREIPRLADAFPIKLADIHRASHVILGDDPFAAVVIDREHLRLRTEQELRNHLLRLRRHAIFADDPRQLAKPIYAASATLAFELGALLELDGRPRPNDASFRAVLQAAARAFDLDGATLETLCDIREGADIVEPRALFEATLRVVAQAVDVADRDEGPA